MCLPNPNTYSHADPDAGANPHAYVDPDLTAVLPH